MHVENDTDQPTVSLCVVLKDRDELKIQKSIHLKGSSNESMTGFLERSTF